MTNKDKRAELFIYVPADRYKVEGLIAIPLNEVAHIYSPIEDNRVAALHLITGEYHGTN
jgi:hypothetical protein